MPRFSRHALIMAGGSGTRFWPRSRASVPKQLLALDGARTLLQATIDRLDGLVAAEHVHVVTAAQQVARLRRQLPSPHGAVMSEPVARNTAAAIALAAAHLARTHPQASMLVLPADHVIGAPARFRAVARQALRIAESTGALVTIGVTPTGPETGYGYIQTGRPLGEGLPGSWVARFIEKPPLARARRLVARGDVAWNAGIFAWRVDAILAALDRHVPEVVRPIRAAVEQGTAAALARAYATVPSVSIDVGVMERAARVAVVRATFPWSDVGSWAALEALWRPPGADNAVRGTVVAVDSTGCIVDAGTRPVALLGVRDIVVVDTPDAVLVCPKARAQDVRHVVEALRTRGLRHLL